MEVPTAPSEAGASEDGESVVEGAPLGPLDWARGFGTANLWDEVGDGSVRLTAQDVIQGRPVPSDVAHPPTEQWMESLPFGPSTPKRLKLLCDKGDGLARRWYVVRPRRCWPQPYDCLAPGVYSAAAFAHSVGQMRYGERSVLFREQLHASLQEAEAAAGI